MKKLLITFLFVGLLVGCQEKEVVKQQEKAVVNQEDVEEYIENIYSEILTTDEYVGTGFQLPNGSFVTYGTLSNFFAEFETEIKKGKTAKAEAFYKIMIEDLSSFKNDQTVKKLEKKYKSL